VSFSPAFVLRGKKKNPLARDYRRDIDTAPNPDNIDPGQNRYARHQGHGAFLSERQQALFACPAFSWLDGENDVPAALSRRLTLLLLHSRARRIRNRPDLVGGATPPAIDPDQRPLKYQD
jgi:hypothetical protein